MDPRRFGWLHCLLLCASTLCAPGRLPRNSSSRVVLYCAQDKEFAEGLLNEFQQKTGVPVAPKYDTEAKKSVTHYAEIVSEQERRAVTFSGTTKSCPRSAFNVRDCWKPTPVLRPLPFRVARRPKIIPGAAFAARARVLLVNTRLVKEADRPQESARP